ncbi:MAG: DNA-processing protein DprA [Phycisphaerales bacterium]|nr:DNA-processing protein DprA [Phycisphaerales bacterium]
MRPIDDHALCMLRIALTPGLGPVRAARCIESLGSPAALFTASPAALQRIEGIGSVLASRIAAGLKASADVAARQLEAAGRVGASIVARGAPDYPPLLAELADAPLILFVRGRLSPQDDDRYPVGIVGSRACTLYGLEQSARFAGALARAGLTVVSGGARGIDTSAHRGALDAGGRSIVVMGCGLAHAYPPENADLFEQIVADDRGAIVSELPIETPAAAENFPGRNRIISGLSLGVLVIEAGAKSGALITARLAAEEQGREVMALPGRVDSQASRGALELIRDGGAAPVLEPGDVIHTLENAARHHFEGTHEARFAPTAGDLVQPEPLPAVGLSPVQQQIVGLLAQPASADQISARLGLEPSVLRPELTVLELTRRIRRVGGLFQAIRSR